jgi:hypothetical protein
VEDRPGHAAPGRGVKGMYAAAVIAAPWCSSPPQVIYLER